MCVTPIMRLGQTQLKPDNLARTSSLGLHGLGLDLGLGQAQVHWVVLKTQL